MAGRRGVWAAEEEALKGQIKGLEGLDGVYCCGRGGIRTYSRREQLKNPGCERGSKEIWMKTAGDSRGLRQRSRRLLCLGRQHGRQNPVMKPKSVVRIRGLHAHLEQ